MSGALWFFGLICGLFLLLVAYEASQPPRRIVDICHDFAPDQQLEMQCLATAALKIADDKEKARADAIARALGQ